MHLAGLGERARAEPGAVALVDDTTSLTWAQVARAVEGVGASMRALASDPDQRVAVVGENAVATLVAHAAGVLAGVGTVAVTRQLTAVEMADQFRDAGAVAVVTGPAGLGAAAAAGAQAGLAAVVVHGTTTPTVAGTTAWSAWAAAGGPLPDVDGRPARPPLVYTSGTTGRARGTEVRWAPSTVDTARAYAAALAARSGFPPGPHLVAGPLQHNGPLTSVRHLLSGQPVVVLGRFDAELALAQVAAHRVTSTVMVPTHFVRLLALPDEVRRRHDVGSLVAVLHTGSACPPHVKRAMIDWLGPVLVESYGGSEIGTVCRITSEQWLARPGSVGRAVPPFEAVVLDDCGRELGPGRVGLLGFRTPAGHEVRYHADEAKTRGAYVAPGVATLGDVGYVDPDGFVFLTDRVADVVVSGGVNLYPAESEQVLLEHPAVAEVAVIGVPHADLGEALHALVVPAGEAPDAAELVAWARGRLAAHKVPRTVEHVDALTRNAMGKLDKRALRRPYWGGERAIAG